jgi:CheY-like chemotaxis protein
MLALLLETEGYAVQSAANGREALAHLRGRARPDLILLDLMMPVMSGWEFREAQKADPALADIPVVIVSAASEVGQKAVALQAAGYLQKPVDADHLLVLVRRLCPQEHPLPSWAALAGRGE